MLWAVPAAAQNLVWDASAPADQVTSYRAYRDGGAFASAPGGQSAPLAVDISQILKDGQPHRFWVTAVNLTGESSASVVVMYQLPISNTPSPDNTKVLPPGGILISPDGARWSFGPAGSVPGNFQLWRNGISAAGGEGHAFKLSAGIVYSIGDDVPDVWYQWTGASWAVLGPNEPGATAPPAPPPPAPSVWVCLVAQKVSTISGGKKQAVVTCDSTFSPVKGDQVKVSR